MTNDKTGRPVKAVSISINTHKRKSLAEITEIIDSEGEKGADIIVLPETWLASSNKDPETLSGVTINKMKELSKKHGTYIICPIARKSQNAKRLNSAALIGRNGDVACIYDKVFPYWSEFEMIPPTVPGSDVPVYQTDFGSIGMAICFDVNFPEVWKKLDDNGAEVVFWVSAYPAGMSLQSHAINHNVYIMTSTRESDCLVYDITGQEILYEKSEDINISRIILDLDRGIYHENFNMDKLEKLLADHADVIEVEKHMKREQWFVLRAKKPGVSARKLAKTYGLEELRDYRRRSRKEVDRIRGWKFSSTC